jgi:hypothetical protein
MIATRGETVRASGGGSKVAALGAAGWLSLAAAPTFAIMALFTGVLGSGRADMLCSPAHGASPLHGMVWMYVLMSALPKRARAYADGCPQLVEVWASVFRQT